MSTMISILISCYNSEKFINNTLDSIIAQTYTHWECLCVDDGSKDNTLNILREYAQKDKRIKVFTKSNGGNFAKSANFILPHIQGDFTIFCGHDDKFSSDLLEKAINRQEETNADIVIPDTYFYHPNKPQKNYYMIGTSKFKNDDDPLINRSIILTNYDAVAKSIDWQISLFALYKTDIIKKFKFYEEGMNGDEFSSRVFVYNANKIAFCEGTYYYYQIDSSITKAISVRRFDIFKCDEQLYTFLENNKFEKSLLKKCLKLTIHKYFRLKKKFYKNYQSFTEDDAKNIKSMFEEGYNNILAHIKNKFYFKLKDRINNNILFFRYIILNKNKNN